MNTPFRGSPRGPPVTPRKLHLRGTLTMDERQAPLPAELGAGGAGGIEWDLSPRLALRFSALVRASLTSPSDLGGRAFVELAARR